MSKLLLLLGEHLKAPLFLSLLQQKACREVPVLQDSASKLEIKINQIEIKCPAGWQADRAWVAVFGGEGTASFFPV